MSATLYFNGIRISVPVEELGEALVQITKASRPPEPRQAPILGDSVPPALDISTANEKVDDEELTLRFLQLIRDHETSGGAEIPAVMRVLGASHQKGVGSKASIVNKVLDRHGFATPDVYTNPRDTLGMRFWRAGPRIKDAIASLSGIPQEAGHGQLDFEEPNQK